MEKNKKTRRRLLKMHRRLLKFAGRTIPFSLIMVLFLAAGQPVQAAFVEKGSAAGMEPEKAASGGGAWEKILDKLPDIDLPEIDLPDIKLPEVDFSKIDREAEKEKLRKAVRTMDELGISPEKIAQRAWEFLSRKENQEKIDEAAREIGEKVQNAAEESGTNKVVKKVTEETGKAADKVTKDIVNQAADKVTEEITNQAADKVTKEIADQAADQVTKETMDQGEAAGQE